MIFNSRIITIFFVLKILLLSFMSVAYSDEGFNTWLSTYKKYALKKGVSKQTIEIAFKNVGNHQTPRFIKNSTKSKVPVIQNFPLVFFKEKQHLML